MNALGIDQSALKVGKNRIPCPACNRGKGDTALSVDVAADGHMVWYCHRCYATGATLGPMISNMAPPVPKTPPRADEGRSGLSDYGRALWAAAKPIGDDALGYLEARACVVPPRDGDLRYLPDLKHPSGYTGPALVGLITHAETGAPLSLHRTWIKPDGDKADVKPPRLLLKNHAIAGGVIRLWPDDAVATSLGIAEGIETALSLAHGHTPVWACIDAGHMGKFPLLPGIIELIIAADNDTAGLKAANECSCRWSAHASVRIIAAETEGCDLNDEVRSWVK